MLYYIRDEKNSLLGFKYNEDLYFYQKNNQEDIIGIYDNNYHLIATYVYDSWGKILSIKDSSGNEITDSSHIAIINPFRYRSYYYDEETKLYYLNTRYYNPEWGRFLNADGIIGNKNAYLKYNLYEYCGNNPINNTDVSGNSFWDSVKSFAAGVSSAVKGAIKVGCAIGATATGVLLGYNIAGSMFAKSFVSSSSQLSNNTSEKLIKKVKKSQEFKQVVNDTIASSNNKSFKVKTSINFNHNDDLHYGIGNAELYLEGKNDGVAWTIEVLLKDTYDFTEHRGGLSFGDIMNDFGLYLQNNNWITPYKWDISFIYYCPSKKYMIGE